MKLVWLFISSLSLIGILSTKAYPSSESHENGWDSNPNNIAAAEGEPKSRRSRKSLFRGPEYDALTTAQPANVAFV